MKTISNKNQISIEYEDKDTFTSNPQEIRDIAIDIGKSLKQTKLVLNDTEVYFPFKPYQNQLVYMTKVIEALNKGSSSVAGLESPTGTGKTLCLLCACLGWLKAKRASMLKMGSKETPPRLFYSSRTHSQLSGVIKELKKTCYLPATAILSSRDNMCVNSLVKNFKGNALTIKCKQIRHRKECKYFFGAERLPFSSFDNCDIEELNQAGSKSTFCPFFFERRKKDEADVVFLPYNYVFDPQIKSIINIKLVQSILIIDEAHNVEAVCEDSVSCQLSFKVIDDVLLDLKGIKTMLNGQLNTLEKESVFNQIEAKEIEREEEILQAIKSYMKSLQVRNGKFWPDIGLLLTPKDFFDIFFEGSKGRNTNPSLLKSKPNIGLDPQNLKEHISFLSKIEVGLSQELQKNSILSEYIQILSLLKVIVDNHLACIQANDPNPLNNFCNNYRFFLNDVEDQFASNYLSIRQGNQAKVRTLFLYCFNPGFGFKSILSEQLRAVIITSGTLSPIEGIESELKCSFDTKLENAHVVDKAQVSFSLLTNSSRRKELQFKFDSSNKNNAAMIDELGYTVIELCRITPGGVLVFFTSYSFMNYCLGLWNDKQVLVELGKVKEVYRDMHDNQKNKAVMKSYTEANRKNFKGKGAVLFSVFRGTTSEGIDFSDDYARMVVLIGIPYPNLGDIRVQMKKAFLDDFNRRHFQFVQDKNIKRLTGSDWYTQAATRTVNQALGRVIRHVNDYGSMVLIDVRFKEFLNRRLFPSWLKDLGRVYMDNKLFSDTKAFFDKMKTYIKKPIEEESKNQLKEIENYEEKYNKDNANAKGGWIKKQPEKDIQNHSGFKATDDIFFSLDYDNTFNGDNNDKNSDHKTNYLNQRNKNEVNKAALGNEKIVMKSNDNGVNAINQGAFLQENSKPLIDETSTSQTKKLNNSLTNLNSIAKSKDTLSQYKYQETLQENNYQAKKMSNSHHDKRNPQTEDAEDNKIQNKSEAMIKKLLELKDRSQLNSLLEKYNMKLNQEEDTPHRSSTPLPNTSLSCALCPNTSQASTEKELLSAKCGHILCNPCWTKSLSLNKQCPICQSQVPSIHSLIHLFIN